MLFITSLFVLCKRVICLIIRRIFFPVPYNLHPVSYLIQADYLLFFEEKLKGGLDFFDDSTHGEFFSRLQIVVATIGVPFPFG